MGRTTKLLLATTLILHQGRKRLETSSATSADLEFEDALATAIVRDMDTDSEDSSYQRDTDMLALAVLASTIEEIEDEEEGWDSDEEEEEEEEEQPAQKRRKCEGTPSKKRREKRTLNLPGLRKAPRREKKQKSIVQEGESRAQEEATIQDDGEAEDLEKRRQKISAWIDDCNAARRKRKRI